MFSQKVLLLAHDAHFGIHEMLRSSPNNQTKGLRRSMCMSFFVMPYTFTVVGRFKMVQSLSALSLSAVSSRPNCSRPKGTIPLSSIAPYICPSTLLRTMSLSNGTFLKRPRTGLCFGHLTKKDIHMLLKQFGDFNPPEAD
jgi:hypothetical protein